MFQVVSGFRESSLAKKRGYFLYSLIGDTCFSKGSSGFIRYKQDSGNRYLQMHSLGAYWKRVIYMDIREMRTQLGDTQSEFSARYCSLLRNIRSGLNSWQTTRYITTMSKETP